MSVSGGAAECAVLYGVNYDNSHPKSLSETVKKAKSGTARVEAKSCRMAVR